MQVFRQSVNLKDEENSFSQSANRLCPIRGSLSPLCLLQNGTKLQYLMYIHMQGYFRWLGLLGPGPMLGRHVNVCATNYIRLCTLLYEVACAVTCGVVCAVACAVACAVPHDGLCSGVVVGMSHRLQFAMGPHDGLSSGVVLGTSPPVVR